MKSPRAETLAEQGVFADRIQQRFWAFHRANPAVYKKLVELAASYHNAGQQRIGIKHLVEVVRWQVWLDTKGDLFKINNDFSSRYARLIMEREPHLRGVFELRVLRSRGF